MNSRVNRRKFIGGTAAISVGALFPRHLLAEASSSHRVVVRTDTEIGLVKPEFHSHFAEHLGSCVYGGLWVGKNSPIPNMEGYRKQAIEYLKDLGVPVLRWPGGCYADDYHWRDGIGEMKQRPKRVNIHWGGYVEDGSFGTHEFIGLCRLIGAEPYLAGNVGSGTPQEMMDWIEYMTSDADTELANLRRRNGRDKAWRVPYVGVGNESWGCGGNMRAEYYADEYRRYQTFIKNYSGNRVTKIASGSNGEDYNWTEVLMSRAARNMQGLSMHYYTLPTGDWNKKGSATQFGEAEWHATLARTLRMEELVRKHSEIMDKYDTTKRVGLLVDEWGTWYDVEPGTPGSGLYQQNSLRDAVAAAINLNIFNQHADRVRMANIAQTVNVLQAVILTNGAKMILTPTYHVFEMFKVHQGATSLPVEMTAPQYTVAQTAVPSLHASASRDSAGRLHLTIANLDPNRAADVALSITGTLPATATARILTAAAMTSVNT
ncbi:MAG TPA: alpha-L-arabinofuranosidase C-terminal domain-containing protein, partial [Bryobacteraceae bacterium]